MAKKKQTNAVTVFLVLIALFICFVLFTYSTEGGESNIITGSFLDEESDSVLCPNMYFLIAFMILISSLYYYKIKTLKKKI